MILNLVNVSKNFALGKKNIRKDVIKNINYSFESGKIYSILGKSGSGKSTLLSLIGLLDVPSSGNIFYNNELVSKNYDLYRSQVSFVFQNFNLIENLTVYENLSIFESDRDKISSLLLKFHCKFPLDAPTKLLSSGEKQRVALIRAYLKGGDILILDEPTANLDIDNSLLIFDALESLCENKIVIIATHNIDLAEMYSDEILEIDNGSLIKKEKKSNQDILNFESKDCFNGLFQYLTKQDSFYLVIQGKEYFITKDNYFETCDLIYSEYTKYGKINYSIKKNNRFHLSSRDQVSTLNFKLFLKNFFAKIIFSNFWRNVFSFLAVAVSCITIFLGANFISYDAGYYAERNYETLNVFVDTLEVKYEFENNKTISLDGGIFFHEVVKNYEGVLPIVYSRLIEKHDTQKGKHLKIYLLKNKEFYIEGKKYLLPDNEILVYNSFDSLIYNKEVYFYDIDSFVPISDSYITLKDTSVLGDLGFAGFLSYDYYFNLVKEKCENSLVYLSPRVDLIQYFSNPTGTSFTSQTLFLGSNIQNENEIIISKKTYDSYISQGINLLNTFIEVSDLRKFFDLNLITAYHVNLYDFYSAFKIVGVCNDDINGADIYFSKSFFHKILQRCYIENSGGGFFTYNCRNFINKIIKQNNISATKAIYLDKTTTSFTDSSFITLYILLGIFLLVSLTTISIWIVFLVKSKYKEISIFKSLGVSSNKISLSFILAIAVIFFVGVIFSYLGGFFLTNILNKNMLFDGYPLHIILIAPTFWSYFLPIVFSLVFPIFLSFILFSNINKIPPYIALKEFDKN